MTWERCVIGVCEWAVQYACLYMILEKIGYINGSEGLIQHTVQDTRWNSSCRDKV